MKPRKTEQPILFSGPMVRAILEGKKSQTRRVMKPQPKQPAGGSKWRTLERFAPVTEDSPFWCWAYDEGNGSVRQIETSDYPYHRPKYRVGDVLWVRETFHAYSLVKPGTGVMTTHYVYKADDEGWDEVKWTSSLFMPCSAARLFLRVTAVRAERLQDITEEDARAEGVSCTDWGMREGFRGSLGDGVMCQGPPQKILERYHVGPVTGPSQCHINARMAFAALWDSINGKEPGKAWAASPWVWCYTFERTEAPATHCPACQTALHDGACPMPFCAKDAKEGAGG